MDFLSAEEMLALFNLSMSDIVGGQAAVGQLDFNVTTARGPQSIANYLSTINWSVPVYLQFFAGPRS